MHGPRLAAGLAVATLRLAAATDAVPLRFPDVAEVVPILFHLPPLRALYF